MKENCLKNEFLKSIFGSKDGEIKKMKSTCFNNGSPKEAMRAMHEWVLGICVVVGNKRFSMRQTDNSTMVEMSFVHATRHL